jgi:peroxidase
MTRKASCPRQSGSGDNNLAQLDLQTAMVFDTYAFNNILSNKGLLHSDQQLLNTTYTASLVKFYSDNAAAFFADFAAAMIKMGDVRPLTGSKGQIRINCRKIN